MSYILFVGISFCVLSVALFWVNWKNHAWLRKNVSTSIMNWGGRYWPGYPASRESLFLISVFGLLLGWMMVRQDFEWDNELFRAPIFICLALLVVAAIRDYRIHKDSKRDEED